MKLLKEILALHEGRFTEDDIALGGTVIYLRDGVYKIDKAVTKSKLSVKCKNGDVVPLHLVVSTDASDWQHYKDKKYMGDYSSYYR